MKDDRPKPETFLERARAEGKPEGRGRLKVYLGMAAGVGKTYTMLSDALVEKKRGIDIVAGYIEPHGRTETENIAKQLERIPSRELEHRGLRLREFDLDLTLTRRPSIVLVDELAHTNAPGSRHTKRWQDVDELLSAGISVYTTVNVQHLESLNDVVSQITGIPVHETVPDVFLKTADEVELVDITPEELLQRLESGKIYSPDKVDAALKNFFQRGNLIALRELVLRHTADSVDVQLRSLRRTQGIETVWPTTPRVLVAVGPTKFAARLVRAASRLAQSLRAELVAASVSTVKTSTLHESARALASQALALAEKLGAETVQTTADDVVSELLRIAQEKNATVIVIGKPLRSRLRDFISGSIVDDLIRRSNDIDVHIVRVEKEEPKVRIAASKDAPYTLRSVMTTLGAVALTTAVCSVFYPFSNLTNLAMIYLLAVAWVASHFGRNEAGLAALISVIAFDICFVPPRWTLAVTDVHYIVTFVVMFVIAILISNLTQRGRVQARLIADRERRTSSLYELSKSFAVAQTVEDIASLTREHVLRLLRAESVLFIPAEGEGLRTIGAPDFSVASDERAVAAWVSEREQPSGRSTETLPGARGFYLPLRTGTRPCPVLGVYLPSQTIDRETSDLIEAISYLITSSLSRIQRTADAQQVRLRVEQEEIRNVLLSSVSHDLRTPLAAIAGSASVVLEDRSLSAQSRELTATIGEEANRLSQIVRNILDLTRLESGHLELQREWQSIEELIGAALERTEPTLGKRKVAVALEENLPLIEVDALLVEQMLINLLENIGRHTPENTLVEISAHSNSDWIVISIADNGPGFADNEKSKLFDKMYRSSATTSSGFGLGLTICRAIATAHGGQISATNKSTGGAQFDIQFPRPAHQPEVVHG